MTILTIRNITYSIHSQTERVELIECSQEISDAYLVRYLYNDTFLYILGNDIISIEELEETS